MSISLLWARRAALAVSSALACVVVTAPPAYAQPAPTLQTPALPIPPRPAASGIKFQVNGAAERLEMTVNTSRVVDFPTDVPRMLVNNPELVRVIPISPKSIQLSALRSGVTQLNVWDPDGNVTSIDLTILGDVQELDMTLKTLFPEASLRLRPLNSSLYISGYVPKAEMVNSIANVARDYFPQIINDMTVGGVQKVLLHVKVMEVSRTKLRAAGFDWAQISSGGFVTQSVSQLLETPGNLIGNSGPTVRFGVLGDGGSFYGFLEALRQQDLAKLMAEPTLTTLSGRPASFNVGGEVPIPMQQSLGVTTVQYREFGTQIDFVPMVLGNGVVRLEVRPQVTEIDPSLRDSVTGVPGFRTRRADTAVEMKAGQTLAIAGLVYQRDEAFNRGIPWLADLPWAGAAFRRVSNRTNEVELLIFVTPEFCDAMDPCEVPPCGPGQATTSPSDVELYWRGYLEVPKANCPGGQCAPGGIEGTMAPGYEELPGALEVNPAQNMPGKSFQAIPLNRAPSHSAQSTHRLAPVDDSSSSLQSVQSSRRTIGTGVTYSTQGGNVKPSQPQNRTSTQNSVRMTQKPSTAARPTLIGPLGYDDLK